MRAGGHTGRLRFAAEPQRSASARASKAPASSGRSSDFAAGFQAKGLEAELFRELLLLASSTGGGPASEDEAAQMEQLLALARELNTQRQQRQAARGGPEPAAAVLSPPQEQQQEQGEEAEVAAAGPAAAGAAQDAVSGTQQQQEQPASSLTVEELVRSAVIVCQDGLLAEECEDLVRQAAQAVHWSGGEPRYIAREVKAYADAAYGVDQGLTFAWSCAVYAAGKGGVDCVYNKRFLELRMGPWVIHVWRTHDYLLEYR